MQAPLDRPSIVAAATATGTAGVLVFALLPIFVGQLAEQYGLNEADAGVTASAYFVIYALVSLTAPLWVRKFSWRRTALVGYVVMVGGLSCLLIATSRGSVLLAMAITGASDVECGGRFRGQRL